MRKLTLLLSVHALAVLPLAACGDDDETTSAGGNTVAEETSGGGGQTVEVAAAPDNTLAFEQASLEARSGEITFVFDNPAQIVHDFCIEEAEVVEFGCTEQVAETTTELSVSLNPGEFKFYCSVAGHRADGMEGTLTVN